MRKVLKWIGIVLGSLVGLVLVVALGGVATMQIRMAKHYDIPPRTVTIPSDSASIARGKKIVRTMTGCWGCHGENLGGTAILDDPMIMTLYAPNLTRGEGGAAATFTPEDWDRAVRHGVGPDGKPLLLMPSQNWAHMTDQDLGDVVAYIKSLPPVDNTLPESRLGPMGYVLGLSEADFIPASVIDQSQPPTPSIQPSVSAEYGAYLVWLGQCHDCHGPSLSGRQLPLPGEPPSRNLTPGGELAGWSQQDFIRTIRTGVTPSGDKLRPPMTDVLQALHLQSDDQLTAIFLYLQSLPPKEFGAK
jgi:mono/diheme cytochrome c family protein